MSEQARRAAEEWIGNLTDEKLLDCLTRDMPLLAYREEDSELRAEILRRMRHYRAAQPATPSLYDDCLLNLLAVIHRDGGHYTAEPLRPHDAIFVFVVPHCKCSISKGGPLWVMERLAMPRTTA